METVILCLFGYLVGSIPSGYLYSKYLAGVDVRAVGSHSTGTTNVLRTGGKKLAIITLLSDVLKGVVVAYFGSYFSVNSMLFMSFCCLIGHVFPVWLKFKGGKGAATAAGTFLVLCPIIALISGCVWGLTAKFIKKSSLASLFFCLSFCIMITIYYVVSNINYELVIYSLLVFVFLVFTHRENIRRLLHQEELEC